MPDRSRVTIYDCGPGYRVPTITIETDLLLSHAARDMTEHELDKLRRDLEETGHARVLGSNGRYFDYERIEGDQAFTKP